MEGKESFGDWLRQRRRILDLTQQELADAVGCSVVTIRKFESDERRPSKQLAELLGRQLTILEANLPAFIAFARSEPGAVSFASGLLSGRYRLEAEMGQGGMGKLYHGIDTQTGDAVAVKALKPEIVAGNPELVARFVREGEALRQLNHPNIVKMLAAVFEDGQHYLIMEFVSGGDLRQLLKREAPLPIPRVIEMGLDLADALTRAHRLDIIHRDLKPANVLIAADGTPRLTDFGVAHVVDNERLTAPRAIIGTLDYLSPEVLEGEPLDACADIWAFGVLLYEMLVGEPPFAGTNTAALLTAILSQPIYDLEQLRPDIPVALVDLIYRMLEKDRHARIASIRHVGAALEDILHDRAGPSAPKRFETPRPDTSIFARPRHNLPAQTTPFVGREDELSELAKLLDDPDIRLITILAPGGMGKSRIALELAERIVNDGARSSPMPSLPGFANGVYYVSLASLSATTEIVPSIAEAVGFRFHSGREQKQQIIDFLREKETLLLMDNYEHLVEGAGLLSEILAAAPGAQLLVTSRERLRLQEETLFRIEGMEFLKWETPEEAMEYSATRLLLQSARRTQPGFQLHPDDLQHVAAICRQVQGMPLAIILAAAWIEALSLPEIASEIARCLDFLETDVQNIPDRHRSIRAVFNPTWNRLSESEQAVFKKLSVFRGGFTREAAQAVAGAVLRQLTVLLGKSLLRRDPNSGRYDVHELLRQYAEEHLMASPDLVSEVRDRHCAYYAAFLQAREDELYLGRQKETASELATNIDNIRLAWSWACQYAKAKQIKQMVLSVWIGYLLLNLDTEASNMAEEAIRSLEAAEKTVEHETALAFSLCIQAITGIRLGQIEKAKAAAERSCHIFETLDLYHLVKFYDPRELLGIVHVIQGNFAATEELGEQIHRAHEGSGKKLPLATAFYMLTIANQSQGKFEAARTYAQQAHTNAFEAGDRWFAAYLLNEWGNAARALGELDEARELYQKGYAIHKDFNDSQGMGEVLNHLANIALLQGELSEAEGYYRQSLTLNRDMGNRGGMATSLEGLGNLMLSQGDTQQAEVYLIEALHTAGTEIVQFTLSILIGLGKLWTQTGQYQRGGELLSFVLHDPASTQEIRERVEQLKVQLGEEADDLVWERGKPLDLETVVAELLAENR